jgi:type I restriction-modification system DNA methylase subunit
MSWATFWAILSPTHPVTLNAKESEDKQEFIDAVSETKFSEQAICHFRDENLKKKVSSSGNVGRTCEE